MDISKYIGLFLTKNEYCYLPGLGSLQINKQPAQYDNDSSEINPPKYSVSFRAGFGSIDDAFANFIANNERVSIVHASNYLKDYCSGAKKQLKDGEDVIIPAIGKFKMNQDGEITFESDPHLNIQGRAIPVFKNSTEVNRKKQEDLAKIIKSTEIREPKANDEIIIEPPKVNWGKIIVLVVVILAVLGAIGYFINNLYQAKTNNSGPEPTEEPVIKPVDTTSASNPTTDTTDETQAIQTQTDADSFLVAINEYNDLIQAKERVKQLNTFGNKTLVWTKDSTVFYVVIKQSAQKDKQTAVDSLKSFFNPTGKVEVVR